jgi:uncharacterized cofD-like protein
MSAGTGRTAVAIGGGTGLPAVIHCLLDLGFETSAVVTMADDGGSSGQLRKQLGMLPPGDVRNCLVAMAEDENGLEAQLFQYRFPEAEDGHVGHALGNLFLAALTDITGSFPEAIATASTFLRARGAVLPSTLADVYLHGIDREGGAHSGQAILAQAPHALARVRLDPPSPPAYQPALEAVRAADVIVIGPGSLFTSLIPNFLVAGIAEAVRTSKAKRVYVCNVANMRGETHGLDAADHVTALAEHGLKDAVDVVLVHDPRLAGPGVCENDAVEPVVADENVRRRIEMLGVCVIAADLADPADPVRHSRVALCRTLEGVVS